MSGLLKVLITLPFFIPVAEAFSQNAACNVLLEGIQANYDGECKKGLAHGEGLASGDSGKYTGDFVKGLPDGEGTMEYTGGAMYKGEWRKGMKDGEGVFTSSTGIVTEGYWNDDEYQGRWKQPYRLISSRGPAKADFRKKNDFGHCIEVKFTQAGVDAKGLITDVNLFGDSGSFQHSRNFTGFDGVKFPFKGRIDFKAPNRLQTVESNCTFEFQIFAEGDWEIVINF